MDSSSYLPLPCPSSFSHLFLPLFTTCIRPYFSLAPLCYYSQASLVSSSSSHDDTTALPSACRLTATQHTVHACRLGTVHCISCILHYFRALCILFVTSCAMSSHVPYDLFVVVLLFLLLLSIFILLRQTTNRIVDRTLSNRHSPSLSTTSANTLSHTGDRRQAFQPDTS
jgi:hypothetical protein